MTVFREFYQEDKLEGAFATFRSIAIVEGDVRRGKGRYAHLESIAL